MGQIRNATHHLKKLQNDDTDMNEFYKKHIHFVNNLNNLLEKEIAENLEIVSDGINHINDVIRLQQSMTRGNVIWTSEEYLSLIINDVLTLMSEILKKYSISVTTDFSEDVNEVTLQKVPFIQMMNNLVKNAKEAIEARYEEGDDLKGEIKIATTSAENKCFKITISDNGCGIEEDSIESIFKHGYTTKKTGSGYGLHSAVNYLQSNNGSLEVKSNGKNTGAEFIITMPVKVGD